ncbi:unnamed protein product, partial [Mesorhabditis belari]|uniref:C-type lectin domain-containing protein n=1 Tax=Mesorhabditis belari TaxID=2138241 RepID=A0AAF3EQH6_9BILA
MFKLIIVALFVHEIAAFCPNGWFEVPQENSCLRVEDQETSYTQAIRSCEKSGGDIVKITDAFFNALVTAQGLSALNNRLIYIGVEKLPDGTWIYADGSFLSYQKWKSGEPNSAYGCAVLDPRSGSWQSQSCDTASPYVCQMPVQANPTGPSTTTAPNCKDGWKAFNGYCYFVQNFTLGSDGLWASWTPDDAQEQCQMRASSLASIHSDAENSFVNDLVASYNVLDQTQHVPSGTGSCGYAEAWIGLRAYPDNTTSWVDGTPVDYSHHVYFPINDETMAFGILNDKSCYTDWNYWSLVKLSARFVCKMKPF